MTREELKAVTADVRDAKASVSQRLRSEVYTLSELARQSSGLNQNPPARDQLEKAGIVVPLSLVARIDFVNRLEVNAFAVPIERRPVVMIFLGLPLLIRAFFL